MLQGSKKYFFIIVLGLSVIGGKLAATGVASDETVIYLQASNIVPMDYLYANHPDMTARERVIDVSVVDMTREGVFDLTVPFREIYEFDHRNSVPVVNVRWPGVCGFRGAALGAPHIFVLAWGTLFLLCIVASLVR